MLTLAKAIIEEHAGKSKDWKVGDRVKRPDGSLVEITGGSFYGGYGRVSNFWRWRKVMRNGSLSFKEESGYGWL